ncbi:unnamed protein product [Mytilus coruscus]|uniref:Uncharacterized protein n=1 Tax=Mytilus coruscus TaxID=42192 RepID=A0A6J8B433_MYTCO|nr:unnamed protein product [Mytilus coruscus]
MKISVVLLFVFVVLEAHYYDRDKTPSCQFPCPWRGRTFDLWEFGKSKPSLYAKVSMDGRTIKWSFGKTTECYQILDGFLVLRLKGEDNWFCSKIIFNRTKRPTTFKIHSGSVGDFVGKRDAFKICEICPYPGKKFYTAVARGGSRSKLFNYRDRFCG